MATIVEDIQKIVSEEPIQIAKLEDLFDEASHDERVQAVRGFSSDIQQNLYQAVEGRAVDLEQIVPSSVEPLTEVIHEGQNTLPVFSHFQKRFCRPPEQEDDVLWGFNKQPFTFATGPGYFVAYEDDENGELCIDYNELPEKKPKSWPRIIDNKAKLGRFVYAGMVDRLRYISEHVTIGRAFKEEPMEQWFVLVRNDQTD